MTRRHPRAWRLAAVGGCAVAGLTTLVYAGWVATARRDLFSDIADAVAGDGVVSADRAGASDALDSGWSEASALLVVVALLLWAADRVLDRRRFGPVGFTGLALVGVGALVVGGARLVASTVGAEPELASRAALAASLGAVGTLLVALGLLTGAVSLLREDRPSYLGYAGWGTG